MKPTAPPKLAIYVRGSTEEQQNTLTAQADTARKYAEWKIAATLGPFIDSGVSGSVAFFERPAVAEMLDAMQREGGTGIILPKLDRGFRDTLDCLFTCAELRRCGIALHILDLNLDTSTEIGEFVLTVMAAVARLENRRRSTRQREAYTVMRRENRLCGSVPYGWDIVGDRLVPVAAEQTALARLVHGDLSRVSLNEAARRLNTEGILTKRAGQFVKRNGAQWICKGKWSGAAVNSVKKNPRLA